jgi:hypothetical protein
MFNLICLQGRGVCRRGFCHCKPGWWGKDCSLPTCVVHCVSTDVTPANTYRALVAGARVVSAWLLPLQGRLVGQGLRAPATLVQFIFTVCYSVLVHVLCVQGRGVCRRGFCHCKAGWRGKDCSPPTCIIQCVSTDVTSANTYCLLPAGAWGVPARLLPLPCLLARQLWSPATLAPSFLFNLLPIFSCSACRGASSVNAASAIARQAGGARTAGTCNTGAIYIHCLLLCFGSRAVRTGAWGVPARLLSLQARVAGQGLLTANLHYTMCQY